LNALSKTFNISILEEYLLIEIIAFDADDTLWNNEHLYHRAKIEFSQLMAGYAEPQAAKDSLDEMEVRNIPYYGYGIKSFGLSMIEAAADVSAGKVSGDEIQHILNIINGMMTAEVDFVLGTEDTLAELSRSYELMLITKGDLFEQESKIERSGVAQYFRYLEIVGEKSEATYRMILGKYNLDPERFLMVGNSLRSDILPVLRIGGQAIYIPNDQTWSHEHAGEDEIGEHEFAQLEHLHQLPKYLEKLQN
jgi:putative hydrolase of the HAD superfamily